MIPFCKTTLGKEEIEATKRVIESGWVVQGRLTDQFEKEFAKYVGSKYAVFVDSGTAALTLSLQYLKNQIGIQKYIVPSFTFTATAEAVLNSGNELEFGDIDLKTFLLDNDSLLSVPVHLGGRQYKNNAFIYDSAHRIEKNGFSGRKSSHLTLECHSFYATKNMSTIQGGMIVTNDKKAYEWLKKARDHGLDMTTEQRYKGKYAQYDIDFVGWRFKSDDLRAGVGIEQLKKLPKNTRRRDEIVEMYNKGFGLDRKGNHLYIVLVSDQKAFMEYMMDNEIQTAINYRPLHTMTGYEKYTKHLPNTEFVGSHCVSLPLYPGLTNKEVEFIIKTAKASGMLI